MTNTELGKMALYHIGGNKINDIGDTSVPAEVANFFLPFARQQFIRQSKLSKTTIEAALALASGETSSEFDYVYALPANCLSPIKLWNGGKEYPPIEYKTGLHSSGTSSVLKTDEEDAILFYSIDVTNLNVFNVDDHIAMSYALASLICMPLKVDDARKKDLIAAYKVALSIAIANDRNGQKIDVVNNAAFSSIKDSRR